MQIGDTCPLCRVGRIQGVAQVMSRDAYTHACSVCGQYVLDAFSQARLQRLEPGDALRLAFEVAARWSDGAGTPLFLDSERLESQLASAPAPRDPLDIADSILLDLARADRPFGALVTLSPGSFLEYRSRSQAEVVSIVMALQQRGLVRLVTNEGPMQLTLDGYERVRELRVAGAESSQVFVAMSFADELLPAFVEGIKPAIEALPPLVAVRVDQGTAGEHNDRIDDRIIREIQRSTALVADVTHHRPGVYFEAGLAMGLGLPVVWCCRQNEFDKCHFDTRQYNHIVWASPAELREKLENRLATTVATEGRRTRLASLRR